MGYGDSLTKLAHFLVKITDSLDTLMWFDIREVLDYLVFLDNSIPLSIVFDKDPQISVL